MSRLVTTIVVLGVMASHVPAHSEQTSPKFHKHAKQIYRTGGAPRDGAEAADRIRAFESLGRTWSAASPSSSSAASSAVSAPNSPDQRPPRTCSSCVDREIFKNFTREEIREKILRKLGMETAPNVTKEGIPMHLVRQLLKHYENEFEWGQNDQPTSGEYYEDEDDDFHFQTRQINIMSKIPESHEVPAKVNAMYNISYFHVHTNQLKRSWRQMNKAHVRIHLPKAAGTEEEQVTIDVSSVMVDKHNQPFLTREKLVKIKLKPGHGGWGHINVMDIVSQWFKYPETNLGITFEATTSSGRRLDIGVKHQPTAAPFLQLDIQDSSTNHRRKRTLNKVCSEDTDFAETHCCLWPFTVDFEKEFGWKWIVYPPKYEANFCSGDCSLGVMMPSNPLAHLLQQANATPCCAPQKMSGINMLYLDDNKNVILGKLPNMKVDRCGCA